MTGIMRISTMNAIILRYISCHLPHGVRRFDDRSRRALCSFRRKRDGIYLLSPCLILSQNAKVSSHLYTKTGGKISFCLPFGGRIFSAVRLNQIGHFIAVDKMAQFETEGKFRLAYQSQSIQEFYMLRPCGEQVDPRCFHTAMP